MYKRQELLEKYNNGSGKPAKLLMDAYLDRMAELIKVRKASYIASYHSMHKEAASWTLKVAEHMGYDRNQRDHLNKRLNEAFEKIMTEAGSMQVKKTFQNEAESKI